MTPPPDWIWELANRASVTALLVYFVVAIARGWWVCTCTTKGKLTIGIGRNLEDRGLTPNEAFYLNANDIDQAGRDDAGNDWRKRRFVHVRGLKLATSGSVLSGLETLA